MLNGGEANANAGVDHVEKVCHAVVKAAPSSAVEHGGALRVEVRRREALRVARRPREPEPVDGGARRRGERPVCVDLAGDEVLHLRKGNRRPAVRRRPCPGGVAERHVGLVEEVARGAGGVGPGVRERDLVAEVLDERIAPLLRRRTGDGVAAYVPVVLLRPVRDVAAGLRPERRVLEPALEVHLVAREVGRRLPDAGGEDDALHPVAREPVQEVESVSPRRARAPAHRRRELVERPGVAGARVEARGGHPLPGGDACLEPGRGVRRHPRVPAVPADLVDRVEVRAEGPDLRSLPGARLRLVRGQGRHGDVVVRARRGRLRQLGRQPQPVRLGVEDDTGRPAGGVGGAARVRLRPGDLVAPELRGRGGRERGDGLRRRRRGGGDRQCGRDHDQQPLQQSLPVPLDPELMNRGLIEPRERRNRIPESRDPRPPS